MGRPYSKNGGDRRPRFWQDRASYRFLPPFFFPPLAAFFAIALIPPFTRGIARSALRGRGAAAVRHAGPPTGARRFVANSRAHAREVGIKKMGVSSLDTPGPAGRR